MSIKAASEKDFSGFFLSIPLHLASIHNWKLFLPNALLLCMHTELGYDISGEVQLPRVGSLLRV